MIIGHIEASQLCLTRAQSLLYSWYGCVPTLTLKASPSPSRYLFQCQKKKQISNLFNSSASNKDSRRDPIERRETSKKGLSLDWYEVQNAQGERIKRFQSKYRAQRFINLVSRGRNWYIQHLIPNQENLDSGVFNVYVTGQGLFIQSFTSRVQAMHLCMIKTKAAGKPILHVRKESPKQDLKEKKNQYPGMKEKKNDKTRMGR